MSTPKEDGVEMPVEQLLELQNKFEMMGEKIKKLKDENKSIKLEVDHAKQQLDNLELKHKTELDAIKASESRLSMKKEGLEQKNQSLVEMVEKSSIKSQLAAGKVKDFELFKEVTSRILREKQDELAFFTNRYKTETNHGGNLAELRNRNLELTKKVQQLQINVKELRDKEEILIAETPKIQADAEVYKGMKTDLAEKRAQLEELLHRKKEAEAKIDKETRLRIFLSTEHEELLHRQRLHEAELEEETRAAAEELLRAKKEVMQRESKYRENERANDELRKKVAKLEEDYDFMQGKLRNMNKFAHGDTESSKNSNMSDKKIVSTLEFEKKELRGEIELEGRQRARLENTQKEMIDRLTLRSENTLILAYKATELSKIDLQQVIKNLSADEKERVKNAITNKSSDDMRALIERLAVENCEMEKKVRNLEVKILLSKD
jgi:hypothetical protein